MAREKIEDRVLTGEINVACKFDNNGSITVRNWVTTKEQVVAQIQYIVNKYTAEGYVLSLRQLHYQFVTRNWIVNHDTAYKKLGAVLDDCRYAGLVDWSAIEDRGRVPYIPFWVNNPDEGLQVIIDQYRINRQLDQDKYVELWTEKDALSGILRKTTSKYHVQLVVNKGYTSSSAAYSAYERVVKYILSGKKAVILYFGDHDPSGLDMIRDIRKRLLTFLSRGHKLAHWNSKIAPMINDWWFSTDHEPHDVWSMYTRGYLDEKDLDTINKGEDLVSSKKYEKATDNFDAGKIAWYLEEHDLFQVIQIGLTMDQIKEYNLPENPTKATDSRSDKYIAEFGHKCWEVDALEPSVLTEIVEAHIRYHIDLNLYQKMLDQEQIDIAYLKNLLNK